MAIYSGFTLKKMWFSTVTLVYQKVRLIDLATTKMEPESHHPGHVLAMFLRYQYCVMITKPAKPVTMNGTQKITKLTIGEDKTTIYIYHQS